MSSHAKIKYVLGQAPSYDSAWGLRDERKNIALTAGPGQVAS